MDMTYVPQIDEATCIAQGDCVELAPDVFDVGDVARVIGTGADALILEAARGCPVGAITVIDAADGRQVYP
jgi:ferredoxin